MTKERYKDMQPFKKFNLETYIRIQCNWSTILWISNHLTILSLKAFNSISDKHHTWLMFGWFYIWLETAFCIISHPYLLLPNPILQQHGYWCLLYMPASVIISWKIHTETNKMQFVSSQWQNQQDFKPHKSQVLPQGLPGIGQSLDCWLMNRATNWYSRWYRVSFGNIS